MSRVGSLTTTFVPPASCRSSLSHSFNPAGFYVIGPVAATTCFPDNYATIFGACYSPGVCPTEYWSAFQTSTVSASGAGLVTETRVICCPKFVHHSAGNGRL